MKAYSTAEVARMTGFTMRQLDYWACKEIITPSIQRSQGPGSRRLYGADDLLQLRFVRQLRRNGWSIQKIRHAINTLRVVMDNPDPLKSAILVHGDDTILALCKTKEGERVLLDALNLAGQQVMAIVLETLATETDTFHSLSGDTLAVSVR